jgi:uncharacterized membrane protein YgcG
VALEQVFSTGGVVRQSTLAKIWRAEKRLSAQRWGRFETSVERSLRARGYLLPDRALPYVVNVGLASLVVLTGLAALLVGAWVGGAIAVAAGLLQLSLTRLLRQRTSKGELRHRQWVGVRNFLHDFSQLGTAPSGHLILWERYLVYAVALGVSEPLARGLSQHVSDHADFASWYIGDGGSGFGSMGHFSHGVSADADGSFSPASESGTGGAFSGGGDGGGGGGGGGGGIGAG